MAKILLTNPKGRTRRHKKATSRSKARSRKNRTQAIAGYYPNPSKRRTKRNNHLAKAVRRRRNPIALTASRGSLLNVKKLEAVGKDAGVGAVGALGVDLMLGYIPLPAMLKTGIPATLTKAAFAVALGYVADMAQKGTGVLVADGALTVILHDLLKSTVQTHLPSVQLGGLGEYFPTMLPAPSPSDTLGEYFDQGTMLVGGADNGMGDF